MSSDDPSAILQPVEFHYQKSNLFRVVYADGVYGGVTPSGMVHCAFYNTRHAIPKRTGINIDPLGGIGQGEKVLESKSGFVREIEVDVLLDFNSAVSLRVWLDDKLENLRNQIGISDEDYKAIFSRVKLSENE